MADQKWKLVNSENVKPFTTDNIYQSRMLTGDEMSGMPIININEGSLPAGGKTDGSAHDETEIYYIVDCGGECYVGLDDERIPVKNGDIIIIPPHVFHWIDNTKSEHPFKLFTLWPKQEQNGMYFLRKEAWGTSVGDIDPDYTRKRLGK